MIACDDTDLFGGRISIVSSPAFCCRIETVGEGLLLAPATSILDLAHPEGVDTAKPVVRLDYDAIWGGQGLLVRHRSLIDFLDALANDSRRLWLRPALEIMSREFRYYGEWKWTAETVSTPDRRGLNRTTTTPRWDAASILRQIESIPSDKTRRRFSDFSGYLDSPLSE